MMKKKSLTEDLQLGNLVNQRTVVGHSLYLEDYESIRMSVRYRYLLTVEELHEYRKYAWE